MKNKITTWIKYFLYICEHKKNVFIECWKSGLYIHAFTHDLSKFLPSEFFYYADMFFSNIHVKEDFEKAWLLHQHRNKHHWDYWVNSDGKAIQMPVKYIIQMLCDWDGMGRKFGDTGKDFYIKNQHKMKLHNNTIVTINEIYEIKKTKVK